MHFTDSILPEGAIWIRNKSLRSWKPRGTVWSKLFLLYEGLYTLVVPGPAAAGVDAGA
jgi:hypothetical protein